MAGHFIETDNLAIIFFGFQIPKCLGGVIVYFLSSFALYFALCVCTYWNVGNQYFSGNLRGQDNS